MTNELVSRPSGLYRPGMVTVLDERLTDIDAYVRRQEIDRLVSQLSLLLACGADEGEGR